MSRLPCSICGMPTVEDIHDDITLDETLCNMCYEEMESEEDES